MATSRQQLGMREDIIAPIDSCLDAGPDLGERHKKKNDDRHPDAMCRRITSPGNLVQMTARKEVHMTQGLEILCGLDLHMSTQLLCFYIVEEYGFLKNTD